MKYLTLAAATLLAPLPAFASDFANSVEAFFETEISRWANDPAFIAAITSQNEVTERYGQSKIDALDAAWRAEVGQSNSPTIVPVMRNATSDILRERVAEYGGQITEIFLMDAVGLNVATSAITSDFWQGDEDKFKETFGRGPGSLHISEIEFDESTQRYQGQVSVTVVDPETGLAVGALTVGVDAESLM